MVAETNVVCTLKKQAGDSEEAKEIGNSGNKVQVGVLASQVCFVYVCHLSQDAFQFYQLTFNLVILLQDGHFEKLKIMKNLFLKSLAALASYQSLPLLLDEKTFAMQEVFKSQALQAEKPHKNHNS